MTNEIEQNPATTPKCPKCGKLLNPSMTRCLCGHELSGVQASAVIAKLVEKFDEIDAQLTQQGLTGSARETEMNSRRARVIRDFPIPNARADLQSLIHFIYPKIQENGKPDPNLGDWRVKFKEVMGLAKQAYRDDAKVRAEFEEIERSLTFSLADTVQNRAKRNPIVVFGAVIILLCALAGVAYSLYGKWQVAQCEKQYEQSANTERERLSALVTQITKKTQDKDYLTAKSSANGLLWGLQGGCNVSENAREKNLWDAKRQELVTAIETNEATDKAQTQAETERKLAAERAEADRIAHEKQAEIDRAAQDKRAAEQKEAARQRAATDRQMEDSLHRQARDAATRKR